MVSYKAIDKAVAQLLLEQFPTIPRLSTDEEEGIRRPSFFIQLGMTIAEDFMTHSLSRNVPVYIYFYPTHPTQNKVEIYEVQDILQQALFEDNLLVIDSETSAEIEELVFDVNDKILNCNFELNLFETYNSKNNEPNDPTMDELALKERND